MTFNHYMRDVKVKVKVCEGVRSSVVYLIADHLFAVWEEGHDQYLSKEKAQEFHTVVAQFLFLTIGLGETSRL